MELIGILSSFFGVFSGGLLLYQYLDKSPKKRELRLHHILFFSFITTIFILLLQYLGRLQDIELGLYDRMMRLRLPESRDDRITIVTINESDIKYQLGRGLGMQGSLSDVALEELLDKINRFRPRTIGLDIYHDYEFASDTLSQKANENENFFTVCKVADGDDPGVAPIPGFEQQRVGFSDFQDDKDGILRRHILVMERPEIGTSQDCITLNSFSFLLSLSYLSQELEKEDIVQPNENQEFQIEDTVLKRVSLPFGGYHNPEIDLDGYQIMLNYRSLNDHRKIAQVISLEAALNEENPETLERFFNEKIILIGVDNIIRDSWLTTNNSPQTNNQKALPGVFVQAHMISQIISAILDDRPLISALSFPQSALGIFMCGIIGGLIVQKWRIPNERVWYSAIALLLLFVMCQILLYLGFWVSLFPAILTLLVTSVICVVFVKM
jgi:CHASE2 domain-containing sensor protein